MCSVTCATVASPVLALTFSASDQTRPVMKSAKKYLPTNVRSEQAAAIDEAAGDGLPLRVAVLVDRIDEGLIRRRRRADVGVRPFAISPAVVAAAAIARLVVDLFPLRPGRRPR